MGSTIATQANVYLRDSATFKGGSAREAIVQAFVDAGVLELTVHRGIMGFDPSSGVLSTRFLQFHPDLPVVVEGVGGREQIETALVRVREVLESGLITLSEVEMFT